jgi:hypothetical protein
MNKLDKKKVEEWAEQQVKYTGEILWFQDQLRDSEREVYFWRDEYIKMMDIANKWKHRFLATKGII